MLIIIEGIDGSGKSTQTKLLVNKLQKNGYKTATLNFPQYQQFFGRAVKRFLQGEFGQISQVNPYLPSVLYAMDRWQTKERLQKWLKQKKIVVLNRYTTSNLVHQTIKLPTSKQQQYINWLEKMEYQILGLPKPDLVIYLYLPYQLSYALIKKRGNKKDIHEADLNHLKAASAQGLKLATARRNWYVVNCNHGEKILSKSQIAEKVWNIVKIKMQKSKIKM
jgi:dTMP kinase